MYERLRDEVTKENDRSLVLWHPNFNGRHRTSFNIFKDSLYNAPVHLAKQIIAYIYYRVKDNELLSGGEYTNIPALKYYLDDLLLAL